MAAESQTTLIGNLTRDPEVQYTASGTALTKLSIAVNRRFQRNDEWQDETSFFNVVCWTDLAENVAASTKKGDRVVVSGRLQQRSWETESNEKRSVVEVVADDVAASLRYATAGISRTERKGKQAPQPPPPDSNVFTHAEPF